MPRKRTKSAIIKSERTEQEKAAAKAKGRKIVNRRYRRKLLRKEPEYDRERKARSRADLTDEEKAAQKEKKKEQNAVGPYYLLLTGYILSRICVSKSLL